MKVLRRLAFLHCEYLGRRESERFREGFGGDAITFLYDTDVLNAYSRPWSIGPLDPNGSRNGYGQIMPRMLTSDSEKQVEVERNENFTAWQVCRALAYGALKSSKNHSIGENGKANKIFQFEPHYKETQKGFSYPLAGNVSNSVRLSSSDNSIRQILAVAFYLLSENKTDQEAVVRWLEDKTASMVISTLNDSASKSREKDRIEMLEKEFGGRAPYSQEIFKNLVLKKKNTKTWSEIQKKHQSFFYIEPFAEQILRDVLENRLRAKMYRVDRKSKDVEALISLALWNRRLLELKINHRIVFVTGDRILVKNLYDINSKKEIKEKIDLLVQQQRQSGSDSKVISDLDNGLRAYFGCFERENEQKSVHLHINNWFDEFSFRFVRHFWAVLPSVAFETTETGKFKDILHGHFAHKGNRLRIPRKSIEQHAINLDNNKHKTAPDLELGSEQLWQELSLIAAKRERLLYFGDNLEIFEKSGSILKEPSEKLRVLMEEIISRHRDRYMIYLSDLGGAKLLETVMVASFPIDLSFRTFPKTNEIFQKLQRAYFSNINHSTKFHVEFKRIDDDAYLDAKQQDFDDRQRSYLKFLVLAALYATSQKWAATLGHVQRAVDIIERTKNKYNDDIRTKNKTSNMSGREAYFLLAVTRRMRAYIQNTGNLKTDVAKAMLEAENALQEARKSLVADKQHDEAVCPGELDHEKHKVRLDSEELAQLLARYYLFRAGQEDQDNIELSAEAWSGIITFLTNNGASSNTSDEKNSFIERGINFINNMHETGNNLESLSEVQKHNFLNKIATCDNLAFYLLQGFVIACFRASRGEETIVGAFQYCIEPIAKWLSFRKKSKVCGLRGGHKLSHVLDLYVKLCAILSENSAKEIFESYEIEGFQNKDSVNLFLEGMLSEYGIKDTKRALERADSPDSYNISDYEFWRLKNATNFASLVLQDS